MMMLTLIILMSVMLNSMQNWNASMANILEKRNLIWNVVQLSRFIINYQTKVSYVYNVNNNIKFKSMM